MADIKLVIKIPEEIIEYIKNNDCLAVSYIDEVAKAIKNGSSLSTAEIIPLEEIDKLHDIINVIGKNADNKGSLYYAVLDFVNKHGTHSTGDYFKLKSESEVKENDNVCL